MEVADAENGQGGPVGGKGSDHFGDAGEGEAQGAGQLQERRPGRGVVRVVAPALGDGVQLGQRRAIFDARSGLALNRSQRAVLPPLLRLELEEFSHVFTTPELSVGLIRLRATLIEQTVSGEKLLAQRSVVVQRPAPSADAPGGVKALTLATDAAIEEIDRWLQQSMPR